MSDVKNEKDVKIGWFHLEQDIDADGTFDIAISDKRTHELISFKLDNLEDYDSLVRFLIDNPSVVTLQRLTKASAK